MTLKQKRFADEYIIDLNATQAAIRAGYSKKTAYSSGQRLLTYERVQNYIQERLMEKDNKLVADQNEVLQYLTSVLRGESTAEIVVVEGSGDGCSESKHVSKAPDEKEKLKAAELLGKRYGLFTDKVNMELNAQVVFGGEEDLED
ncbi:MAG: terminase small subunit [Anaerovoracaceae bacterium]